MNIFTRDFDENVCDVAGKTSILKESKKGTQKDYKTRISIYNTQIFKVRFLN